VKRSKMMRGLKKRRSFMKAKLEQFFWKRK
jgi:hypothetical protein